MGAGLSAPALQWNAPSAAWAWSSLTTAIRKKRKRSCKPSPGWVERRYRVFALEDTAVIDSSLGEVGVLLNCAGPFARTANVLIKACIRQGMHYLDVAAELDSYRLVEVFDGEAKAAGVMLLPGSGGSVAMLGWPKPLFLTTCER